MSAHQAVLVSTGLLLPCFLSKAMLCNYVTKCPLFAQTCTSQNFGQIMQYRAKILSCYCSTIAKDTIKYNITKYKFFSIFSLSRLPSEYYLPFRINSGNNTSGRFNVQILTFSLFVSAITFQEQPQSITNEYLIKLSFTCNSCFLVFMLKLFPERVH